MPEKSAPSIANGEQPPENPWPKPDVTVDASGQTCPVPLLMTRQAAKTLPAGRVLCVISSDEHTGLDLEAWCLRFGHTLLGSELTGCSQKYWIRLG
jgi:TusA-related sulfurtransferase